MSIVMETERLLLRPWRESDAEILFRYAKDPDVGPAAGWPPHTSVEESLEIIRTVFSAPETYAVVLKQTDEPVGSCGIIFAGGTHSAAIVDGEGEIGYWIGVPYWGNGYIPEAVNALISRSFNVLGLSALWIGYYDGNRKSSRVAEKCGFTYHHSESGRQVFDGECRTEHFMRLERAAYVPDVKLRRVHEDKGRYMELLLVGDEQESMVRKYLPSCALYVVSAGGLEIGICAVDESCEGCVEIKNIAIIEGFRRKGYGRAVLGMIADMYPGHKLKAGTGEVPSTVGFYKACGFAYSSRVPDFFTDNYDHAIIEDGVQLKDMVYYELQR